MKVEIVALGEPMLEFNASEEGALYEVKQFLAGWGGDTSNFSVAASRAGNRVGYLTRLGEDEFGESFLQLWQKEGIDTRFIEKDPTAPTGIYFISRSVRKHHFTYYRKYSAASRMTPDFLPAEYIRGARLLHVSGISQGISTSACDTVFAAIGLARDAGVLISYDPNFRPKLWNPDRARAVIHETIRQADLVFPSIEDARALSGLEEPEEIVRFYLGMGPKVVVLKMGGDGALLAAPEDSKTKSIPRIQRFRCQNVDAVDMSGAGDTFDAYFVNGYLSGWPLEKCAEFANAAAALTTTGLGCVTPVPVRAQVEALLGWIDR
ncbi:MAG: sugar kinase [Desulfobacteraceae bacterium]|nr:MAG: sugar kinase [Desulfobacteraceae bacterium]